MILKQYYLECLSQASYLVGDEKAGRAIVVDPRRDVADYLQDAADLGVHIEGVINTHFHADFVSGHLELVEATGAWIGFGEAASTEYPIRRLTHGERLALGDVELEILSTPGHTWESISVLVRETPDGRPVAVLTGDALFIGDVGRPDLVNAGESSTEDLAKAMYRTVHETLLRLPDDVAVMPAHGAGSSCGKNLSAQLTSTIGEQRHTNPSVQPMAEGEFVALLTAGQPAPPAYFGANAELNKQVHPLFDEERETRELTADQLRSALATSVRVIDARSMADFATAHLRGSVNVGFDGRFAETVGMVTGIHDPIAVVAYPADAADAVMRLARIGADNVLGCFVVSDNVFPGELADLVQPALRVSPGELDNLMRTDAVTVLDVRNPGEREDGKYLPGAIHVPLAQLRQRTAEIPTGRPIVVHCAGGWRSSVAASLLRSMGIAPVSDLEGGYGAWSAAHADTP